MNTVMRRCGSGIWFCTPLDLARLNTVEMLQFLVYACYLMPDNCSTLRWGRCTRGRYDHFWYPALNEVIL